MRRIVIFGLAAALVGCVDAKIVPLLGNWPGGFRLESVKGQSDPKLRESLAFRGYLQLYRTQEKFKMRLENRQQAVEIKGTWHRRNRQLELEPGEFSFENPPEEQQPGMKTKIVTPEEIRAAYGKKFYLDLSADEKVLSGPLATLGNLTGRHFFAKGVPPDLAEREYEKMRHAK